MKADWRSLSRFADHTNEVQHSREKRRKGRISILTQEPNTRPRLPKGCLADSHPGRSLSDFGLNSSPEHGEVCRGFPPADFGNMAQNIQKGKMHRLCYGRHGGL